MRNSHTISVVFLYVMGLIFTLAAIADSATTHFENPADTGIIPDGRIVSGDFIVGEPTEIRRLFKNTTESYNDGSVSNAAHFASEATKRYEASKNIAGEKTGFMTPLLQTQMAFLYRIQAEVMFASDELVKAMGSITVAIELDSGNVTNQVVRMCIATDLGDYEIQDTTHKDFLSSSDINRALFYNELIKRGWLLPFDLTDEEFLRFEKIFGITNRLDRPKYFTDKDSGHKFVYRWKGLSHFQKSNFTELKKHVQNTRKIKSVFKTMHVAQKENNVTGVIDLASNCLAAYSRLSSEYIKEHAALTQIPMRCHLALAEAFMADKEYEMAMQHVLIAEDISPSVAGDFLKTIIWILDDKPKEASRLALKYKRLRSDKKTHDAYFAMLIAAGYISDRRWFSDEPSDIKTDYEIDCEVMRPTLLRISHDREQNIGNRDIIQQWTGLNTMRFEPVGTMRQQSWNAKTNNEENAHDTTFCLDTLEVSNPSSNGLDVVLVVTPHYEKVFSYIWNDPAKETGWYDFDTNARATNVFVRSENILWFSNRSAKLTRFTLRGAI